MNPSNTSSTPLQDWTEEKSPMGHPAPPPYQDAPYPGMPPPGPGYPPQQVTSTETRTKEQKMSSNITQFAYGHQPYPMVHQYPAQPGTVTVQPTVFVSAGPLANPVNDYLGYSIFTLLFCCLPLGVAALIYSISVSFFRFFVDSGALTPIHIARFLPEPDPCQLNSGYLKNTTDMIRKPGCIFLKATT
uniref:Uncharacterized protein n=1 Tax=Stegastes partitus TaxID=144197 RepID=A0A3B5ATP6_9TELE